MGGCYGWVLWVDFMGGCYGWVLWVDFMDGFFGGLNGFLEGVGMLIQVGWV